MGSCAIYRCLDTAYFHPKRVITLGQSGLIPIASFHRNARFDRIVLDTARAFGMPLPAAANHMQLYESMLQLGMRELDNSAVIGVLVRFALGHYLSSPYYTGRPRGQVAASEGPDQ